MSSYTLANTAAEIDSAITRVSSADAVPTANSQSMVTSGGVKTYLDSELATMGVRVGNLEANSGNTNVIAALTTPISVTGTNRVSTLNLDMGDYTSLALDVNLTQIDAFLVQFYMMTGNNDYVVLDQYRIEDNTIPGLEAERNMNEVTFYRPNGVWQVSEKLWMPTFRKASSTHTLTVNTTSHNDDWYFRADVTHVSGT